jgi:predicted enzyme related to lactoylglutathione lyase
VNPEAPSIRMHAIVLDCAELEPMVAFWSAALGYVRWFEPFGQYAWLRPPDGGVDAGPCLPLIFQRVPGPKIVKNRAHVDYDAADRPAEVERLVALGGRTVREVDDGPGLRWTVMTDPAGNEFCVTER